MSADSSGSLAAGSNDNSNGPLRQYVPKGTDLTVYDADDLARVAASLNNY